MDRYDKFNILWDKEYIYEEQFFNVEEWVKNVFVGIQDVFLFLFDYVERVDSFMVYFFNGKVNDKWFYLEFFYKFMLVFDVVQEFLVILFVDDFRQFCYSSSGNFEIFLKRIFVKGRVGKLKRIE